MGSCLSHEKSLFDQVQVGDITLSNRIVMAAMTRLRADPKTGVPNDLHVKYYSQRATAGLILTECSAVSNVGNGLSGSAGIYTKEQAAGWKKVTQAVHERGGKIFLQIWHGGRASDPKISGETSLAPSALPIRSYDDKGVEQVGPVPKEMTKDDIKTVVEQFRESAKLAKEAGFDGLELHGANGYLIDQFIRDSSNQRKDEYGGSVENRCRFPLEVIDALIEVFGAGRVGIKLTPVGRYQYMYDSNPIETYSYLLTKLSEKKIAFVELMEPNDGEYIKKSHFKPGKEQIPHVAKQFRNVFKGTLITNAGYKLDTAAKAIKENIADLVSFGKLFINNPDLVQRAIKKWPLNDKWDFTTFFSGGEKGYIDYPTYDPNSNKTS